MNESLEARALLGLVRCSGWVSVAESCTGGLLGARLTAVSGSSQCFAGGIIAYQNAVKVAELGVPEADLVAQGAVSDAVARAMAIGVRERFGSDIGLSTTGIAGPGGGTESKPVGLVFIGIAAEGQVHAERNVFSGTREQVRTQTCDRALELLLEWIAFRSPTG